MKKILSLIIGMLMLTASYAQEKTALVVRLNNGSENAFVLSEKPTVVMQDDKILVKGVAEITYMRSEISKLFFEEISSDDPRIIDAIESIGSDNVTLYYVDGENVCIIGLKEETTVSVASLDGKSISTQKSNGTGSITISLGNYPKGIYIVSFGSRNVKILKKK